jgi:hypothetical protein
MTDHILNGFLERQYEDGMALAERSDLLELVPLSPRPVQYYVARYGCKGLVRRGTDVVEADNFEIGFHFPSDYLRRAHAGEVLTLFSPAAAFHPNLRMPLVCPGWLRPGTSLPDLLFQCFDILTYKLVTMNELNALNFEACAWARDHQDRFPVDPRPLCRPCPPRSPNGAAEVAS